MTFRCADAEIWVGADRRAQHRLVDRSGARRAACKRASALLGTARPVRRALRRRPAPRAPARAASRAVRDARAAAPQRAARCPRCPASTRARSCPRTRTTNGRGRLLGGRAQVERPARRSRRGRRRPRSRTRSRGRPRDARSTSQERPKPSPTSSSAAATKIDVAGRLEPLACERRDGDGGRRDLALHVERAAAPHVAVAKLARPRVERPLARLREHGVGVREEEEARRIRVAPGNPGDEVRPLGSPREEPALDAVRLEVARAEARRPRVSFPGGLTVSIRTSSWSSAVTSSRSETRAMR